MINYTGNQFVDVGVSVLENYLEKPCEEFTKADLEKAANWLKTLYTRKDLKGYLTVHFPNSGWCNPTILDDKKQEYLKKVLESYKGEYLKPTRSCSFCNKQAQFLADRQHIPLLTGATLLVTAPYGVTGLPVCGYCLFAIQFYPLATLKVQGRPLFWWTPNPDLTYELAKEFYIQVMQIVGNSGDKFPNLNWPRTRLFDTAKKVSDRLKQSDRLVDCIGYHVTNYGSAPDYQEYLLPKALLDFWKEVRMDKKQVREAHEWVIESCWEKSVKNKQKVNKENNNNQTERMTMRNFYYEDLSKAFSNRDWDREVKKIVGKYFIFRDEQGVGKNCFDLAGLFLRKVGGMDKKRIDTIKQVSDKITEVLILGNNEKRWFRELYMKEMKYSEFLRYLVRVQKRLSEQKDPISMDEILIMLDLSNIDDASFKDTWLVRDLLLLRMLEQLGKQNQDIIKEVSVDEEVEKENID